MIARTTTTVPMIIEARDTLGILTLRILKIVDIAQWPPRLTGGGTSGGGKSGTCGPGPGGGGGPGNGAGGYAGGGYGPAAGPNGSVRAPGGAGANGTGVPGTS